MKKLSFLVLTLLVTLCGAAQNCYWVFLTDKAGTSFDPYSYFDAKAIERYKLNNADLYDITNYPLNQNYVNQVDALATEEVGQTRWLNAVAVMATPAQIAKIEALTCVKETRMIAGEMQMAACKNAAKQNCSQEKQRLAALDAGGMPVMSDQLLRMQGNLFRDNNIDGKGVRIAVFDGGFPRVNTHAAFKHLRDNHQIIATWNFCNKKENVYGWNTHGTMVLSCIAGILNGKQLGLATGATFLLARTEVEPEPYKEEVWWMQAVEWADKNGADVINSSLGYGKDRHYTYEMDGRSTVAHAANMAARKGMLVCNSAGNEGSDKSWKTIITPADADSILTVGGISATLFSYEHIEFSSFGPTADGRMKPNVCNFGQADVADPKNDTAKGNVFGTSFSSPLTAGFCACAWQTRKGLTAMQMKAEVEKSADLYPYFDYAYGYGVPQAGYFVNNKKEQAAEPTFTLQDQGQYLMVKATGKHAQHAVITDETGAPVERESTIFMKVTDDKGLIQHYVNLGLDKFDKQHNILVHKSGLVNKTLTVFYDGYIQDYKLSKIENDTIIILDTDDFYYSVVDSAGNWNDDANEQINRSLSDNKTRALGDIYFIEGYVGVGTPIHTADAEQDIRCKLPLSGIIGVNYQYGFKRWYRLGIGAFYATNNFVLNPSEKNPLDEAASWSPNYAADKKLVKYEEFGLEVFQRIRLKAGGEVFHNGLFWDLGLYGSCGWNKYEMTFSNIGTGQSMYMQLSGISAMDDYSWNWGINTRFVNDWYGIYLRYRLNGLGKDVESGAILLPRLQMGLILNF
jgi:subtilisin family serine protease